jgi:ABC-2 type transport system permease protein
MNTFTWLIKREFWETRSAWVGPLATAAALMLIAFAGLFYGIDGSFSAEIVAEIGKSSNLGLGAAVFAGLGLIAGAFFVVLQITQYSYLVDCLYSERKDRSILFWKSLPISDAQTVLAKLAFALLVMPSIALAALLSTQVVVYLAASIKLGSASGMLGLLWSPSMWMNALTYTIYLYFKVVLWALPLMAWLVLVSGFAPRSPMGVAILIPAVTALIENLLVGTHVIGTAVMSRLSPPSLLKSVPTSDIGITPDTMQNQAQDALQWWAHPMEALRVDVSALIANPGLWIGLLIAAGFVMAAIEVRRRRDPSA